MTVYLSIFIENKPGKLERITGLLGEAGINIMFISVSSAGEHGILKMLVEDPDRAFDVLKENHVISAKRDILLVELEDRPGALNELLVMLSKHDINLEDVYGYQLHRTDHVVMVIESPEQLKIKTLLEKHELKLLSLEDIKQPSHE